MFHVCIFYTYKPYPTFHFKNVIIVLSLKMKSILLDKDVSVPRTDLPRTSAKVAYRV